MELPTSSPAPAFSQPDNTPSSSEQAGDGHRQLRHLQQRLKETPLSNKQLDETRRTELETQLLMMVCFNLTKTTPTYQEQLAPIIIKNWKDLSDKTKTLITSHCEEHLAYQKYVKKHFLKDQGICNNYKETLETILEKTSQAAPTTIHTQTPESIALSTSEIQEEPSTLPEAQQPTPEAIATSTSEIQEEPCTLPEAQQPTPEAIAHSTFEIQEEPCTLPPITTQHIQWNNAKTTEHKPLALLPFSPSYKQGHKIRWFENKDWRTLKNELKQKYVETEWMAFSKGANIPNTQTSDQTKQAILFSDFQARGNLLRVLGRLQKVKDPDTRKKAAQTLAGQLVDAVYAMHNLGIKHMDLKPKHILLSKQGTVVLSHFGLATRQAEKAKGPPEPSKYMSRYAAPEDELGLKRATRPCDLYSLAALLKTIQKTARLSKDDPIRQLSNLIHAKRLQPNAWEEIQLAKQESGLNHATDLNEVLFPNKPSAPAAVERRLSNPKLSPAPQ